MLWCKLIKAKDGVNLTTEQKAIRKAVRGKLQCTSTTLFLSFTNWQYTDSMGKETRLEIPALPTTVVANFGNYHAAEINTDTHNLITIMSMSILDV